VPQSYRVRYSLKPSGQHHSADVVSADVGGDLEDIPEALPAGAYIMYVEDLTAGRDVHWTRWPKAFRPGFGSLLPMSSAQLTGAASAAG
jgi:hypothetical protein